MNPVTNKHKRIAKILYRITNPKVIKENIQINHTTISIDKTTCIIVLSCWINERFSPDTNLDQVCHTLPTWHTQDP